MEPLTSEELEILNRLRAVKREAADVRLRGDQARLEELRAEVRELRIRLDRANRRKMFYLGHIDLFEPDLIE